MGTDLKEEMPVGEFLFENILIPMPVVELPVEDDGALHPVTQVDMLLRDSGIPIVGVSPDEKGFRIDFAEGASEEEKAEAYRLLEGKSFEPRLPMTVADLAESLTDDQVAAALRYAAAREYFLSPELAKQQKVDIYVSSRSPAPADPDGNLTPTTGVRGLRESDRRG